MRRYFVRRVLSSIPVLLVVAVITFGILHLTPGDPAEVIAGPDARQEDVEAIRTRLGLDRSPIVQFGQWMSSLARGDLGVSAFSGQRVTSLIAERIGPTVSIALLAALLAISVGIPLGVLAAWKANTWIDRTVMIFAVLGLSLPVFFLGFVIMWVVGIKFHLLPVAGYSRLGDGFGEYLKYLVLPSLTASLTFMALITRMTRASTLEVLGEDYIRTARAKGLQERLVLFRHALRNAALPILTVVGFGLAFLVSGLVVVESVFAVPGLGRLLVDAIRQRDYSIIQGVVLTVSAFYVLVNLTVDLLYTYVDPRVRY